MSKMLVVVFDQESQAFEGSRALAALHREGSITAYAGAIVARDADGRVSVNPAQGGNSTSRYRGRVRGCTTGPRVPCDVSPAITRSLTPGSRCSWGISAA